ncbi:hypothetical protein pipiens_004392 [Culex pipiens pipiens]|uniref:C2H2-type domain-containing protein n=1 Tax=Culex pipiens pipiens TaxID=38569 RepID=A0ABD1CKK9_CULPP
MDSKAKIKPEITVIKTEPVEFEEAHHLETPLEPMQDPETPPFQPEPFCSLCLRERVTNTVFYTFDVECSGSLRDTLKDTFGLELAPKRCHICTPCRKLLKLVESFRDCCLKAHSWAEQHMQVDQQKAAAPPGSLKLGGDSWFSDGTVQAIDLVREAIKERTTLIVEYDKVEVKMELGESMVDDGSNAGSKSRIKECRRCHRKFDGPRSYTSHKKCCKGVEEDDNLHCCNICSVSFRREQDLETHVNMHEGNKPYECRVTCGERFYGKNQRFRHEKLCRKQLGMEREPSECSDPETDHEPMEINECERCKRRFDGKQSLISHITHCQKEGDARRLFNCDICSISFSTNQMLKAHLNKHKGIKPYKCRKFCDKKFYGGVFRYRHEKVCRELEVKAVECAECHRFFSGHRGLLMHVKTCRKDQQDDRLMYTCEICKISFTNKLQLDLHRNKHKGIKPFECEFNCGKSFFGPGPMRTHAKICSRKPALLHPEPSVEEVPPAEPEPESDREDPNAPLEVIRCENCDRLFDSKGALMGHLNFCRPGSTPMNNDQLFYSCPICSVSFTRKPRLEAHLNKHNGIKAFKCGKCGQDFFNLKPKNKHEKNCNVHRCKTCKVEYSSSQELVDHVKEAHAQGKLTCETCGAQFLRNFNFMRHRRQKHPEEFASVVEETTEQAGL